MNVLQTTPRQDAEASSYTDLYINIEEAADKLKAFGGLNTAIHSMMDSKAIVNASVAINCLAATNNMYPLKGPWQPLQKCGLKSLSCILMGGLPVDSSIDALESWTGSAYTVREGSSFALPNPLHDAIGMNEDGNTYRTTYLARDLNRLQLNGVMLLPEVLSTYKGGNNTMAMLWEPFLWTFLNEITSRRNIPIIFTSQNAYHTFETAVHGNGFVQKMFFEEKAEIDHNKALHQLERELAKRSSLFNFYKFSTRQ